MNKRRTQTVLVPVELRAAVCTWHLADVTLFRDGNEYAYDKVMSTWDGK